MITQTETLRDQLKDLDESLSQEKREDNSCYFFLKDESKNKYQELIRSLHMDEMPNDWRYETIKNLVSRWMCSNSQEIVISYIFCVDIEDEPWSITK